MDDLKSDQNEGPEALAADEWDAEIVRRLQQVLDGSARYVDRTELQSRMRQQFALR